MEKIMEQLEKYHLGQLSTTERTAMEQQIASDPQIADLAKIVAGMVNSAKIKRIEADRQFFREIGAEVKAERQTKAVDSELSTAPKNVEPTARIIPFSFGRILAIAATVALVIGGFWYLQPNDVDSTALANQYLTIQPTSLHKYLTDTNYKGDNEVGNLTVPLGLMREKDFVTAETFFADYFNQPDSLLGPIYLQQVLRLEQAKVWLKRDKVTLAETQLVQLQKETGHDLAEDIEWLLAWVDIKTQRWDSASTRLTLLSQEGKYQEKAMKLLDEID